MHEEHRTLEHAASIAAEKGICRFTRFLDAAQCIEAKQLAHSHGVAFSCFGGYDDAERVIGCFHPTDESVEQADYPLVCLCSGYTAKFCSLSHRDILGAFMALGLTRDCVGDIIISDKEVFLFAGAQTADYIAQSLKSAGKVPLDLHALTQIPPMPAPKGTTFGAVVSSLRLDAVLAAAYRLSRSESAEIVRAGLVKVNHLECNHVDTILAEGALLSVRGKGRVRLVQVGGFTRKQRIGITFFRYE